SLISAYTDFMRWKRTPWMISGNMRSIKVGGVSIRSLAAHFTRSILFLSEQLWTAPELLRNPNPPPMGTQKGDIYSFAIILHEVLWRKGVFPCKNENLSPYEIVQRVKKTVANLDDVFRPYVPDSLDADDEINQSLLELMRCSWAEDPHDRPDISMIRKAVRMLNKWVFL
ncbi:hypothetical protein ANCDUO_25775, partial [Ancylostoma duodenale]